MWRYNYNDYSFCILFRKHIHAKVTIRIKAISSAKEILFESQKTNIILQYNIILFYYNIRARSIKIHLQQFH